MTREQLTKAGDVPDGHALDLESGPFRSGFFQQLNNQRIFAVPPGGRSQIMWKKAAAGDDRQTCRTHLSGRRP